MADFGNRTRPAVEAYTFAVSTEQVRHLLGDGSPYEWDTYRACTAISLALRERGIGTNGVAGGFNFYLTSENAEAASDVLATFGIELGSCGTKTFAQRLNSSSGGLEELAASGDPLAQLILSKINPS